jgi:hypothetical protein
MAIELAKRRFLARSVALSVWILAASPLLAQRVCCQGDLWLKWKHGARESYVWGFTEGYTKGQMDGCEQGRKYSRGDIKSSHEDASEHSCPKEEHDFSKGSDYLVRAITDFYTRYPEDRDIYIDEILDLLGKGQTLEQIHNHPFWRHKPPQPKP